MSKVFLKTLFYSLILILFLFFFSSAASAAYEKFAPGATVSITEFVYNDDFTPYTTDCTLAVYKPDGSAFTLPGGSTMTTDVGNGRHYKSFIPDSIQGIWSAAISCGTVDVDLAKLDKTFVVGYVMASASAISDAVWSAPSRSLSTFGTLVSDVWGYAGRTLTGFGTLVADIWANGARTLSSFGSLAADVWTSATRRLTTATLDSGSIATQLDVQTASSSLGARIDTRASQASLNALNNISAADVWAYSSRSITNPDTIWEYALTQIGDAGSVGKLIKDNLDATISSRGTSNLTAADVWSSVTRTLTSNANFNDPTSAATAAAVWAEATRTLTNYGNDITAQNVWDILSVNLTTAGSIGKRLADNVDVAVSTRSTLSAADVWAYSTRSLTTFGTLVADIWANGARTLSSFGSLAADVWTSATRRLTTATLDSGSIATQLDVQTASSSLGALINTRASLSNQLAGWTVTMSNADRVLAGNTYRTKIFLTNYASVPTNSFTVPAISLYDSARNLVVSGIAMTNLSAGVYEYTYSIPAAAAQGLWESIVSTEVESGKTIQTNDYWTVEGSPAQVIINSITDDTIPSINANVTISNEGLTGYEYQYEWCVVAGAGNSCGGGDDVFYASAAKYLNAGEDWNTNLTATVPSAGDYYFKLVVYYGVEQSGAARSFTAFSLAPTLSQEIFRFFTEHGSLNPNDPWPPGSLNNGENSDIFESQFSPLLGQVLRLRIGLKVTTRDLLATQKQFKMQFAELTGSSCSNQSSGWTDMGNPGSAALWRGIDMPGIADGAALPQNLLSMGTVKGSYEKQNPTSWNPAVSQGQIIEYDWAMQNNISSPTGKNYCFRAVESGGTVLDAYTRYPRVATIFTPSGSTSSTINYATGGNLQHINANGSKMTMTAPANYLPASHTFDIFSFDYSNYINQIGVQPSGKSGAHSYIYRMSVEKDNVPSASFNQPLTLKIDYRDSEVASLNESSLVIYKYNGTDWTALSTTVDTVNNIATATVTSFSSFGLFGDATVTPTPTPTATQDAGGGGGGGGGAAILPASIPSATGDTADFNNDGKVNSVDFSIMLFFWKAKPPFNNLFVDTNKDGRVDSIDFSILMYRWGRK